MAAGPLLELRGVRKRYPAVVALEGASLISGNGRAELLAALSGEIPAQDP